MSDAAQRDRERRQRAGEGDLPLAARVLLDRVRTGALPREHLVHLALLGDLAAGAALGPAAPAAAEWSVWSLDTFDRDMPPQRELGGRGALGAGLAELWARTLAHALRDDGRATFTRFHLRWSGPEGVGGATHVPVDPFSNPGLARLRRWTAGPGAHALLETLAAHHLRLLRRGVQGTRAAADVRPLLAAADGAPGPAALERALGEL